MPRKKNSETKARIDQSLTTFPDRLALAKYLRGQIIIYDDYFMLATPENKGDPSNKRYVNKNGEYFDVTLAEIPALLKF